MTINLADNDPRNEYTVSDGNSQTVFTMDFEIFDNADLNVYVDNVKQTLTTHYKISDSNTNANAGHTSGTDGFVHFTSAVTASGADKKIVLTRSIVLQRTTDFPASGAFQIGSLNTELDKIIAIQADLKDDIDRSLRLTDSDVDVALTLPNVDTRKGKTLAFNATTGVVEAGPSISGVTTVSATAANIDTVAGIASNVTSVAGQISPTNNISTVAGAVTNINLVGGSISNVNTVAANISAIGTASANATLAENYATKTDGAVETSPDRYSSEAHAVGGTGVTSVTGSAREWAIGGGSSPNATTAVDSGGEFSAKGYAVGSLNRGSSGAHSAKDWATYTSGTVDGSLFSAKYYAEQAAASFDSLDDKYLGSKSSDPTVDNDGNTLIDGALYFDTSNNKLKVYDLGNTQWIAIEAGTTAGFAIAMAIAL